MDIIFYLTMFYNTALLCQLMQLVTSCKTFWFFLEIFFDAISFFGGN